MSAKGKTFIILLIGVLLFTLSQPQQLSEVALASSSSQGNVPNGATIAYPGRLNDAAGQPVTDGTYAFTFDLYDSGTGGQMLWSEVQEGVAVRSGSFTTYLGSVIPIPAALLDGRNLWLSVSVRGPQETEFTALTPRQPVSPNASIASPSNGGACPHDHVGDVWTASVNWSNGALRINNSGNGPAFWGWNTGGGNGVRGDGWGAGIGVYGEGENGPGVAGRSAWGYGVEGVSDSGTGGVYAHSVDGYGLFAHSDNNSSIYVDGAGGAGVYVESAGAHGIYVGSAGWNGVTIMSAAAEGLYVDSATFDGILVNTAGWDGIHVTGPVGGTYYGSGKKGAEDFAVLNTGEVRSKVGFATPANDYAVMMNVLGTKSDYEPGDVLVISGDQTAGLCAASYSPTVIGVYSAAPGFLGGQTVNDLPEDSNMIAVAIMGIVTVKVSAENGAIHPGDLLVTSSTPGYAMRGDNPATGTILGKALESLDSGTGLIQVLLMLR